VVEVKGKSLSLEMGFTRDEFVRLLTKQNTLEYMRQGNLVRFYFANKTVALQLGEQKVRRIASLSLPRLTVDFDFATLNELEQKQFMKQFMLKFNRGGG